jgi:predicted branched-subunit amino acid permease
MPKEARLTAPHEAASPEQQAPLSLLDPRLWRHPAFAAGAKEGARVMPGMMAWGVVTGMAMTQSGLPLSVVLLMSLSVYGAGAQLASVPLLLAGAPLWVVWMTAICVNLRFVIFSAQIRPHMMCLPRGWRLLAGYLCADVAYVMTVHRYGGKAPASAANPEPVAFYLAVALVNWVAWNAASLLGVLGAAWIPTHWGLGFAGTLALLALLVTLAKDRPTAFTAGLAGSAAVALFALPFRLNIVVAVAAAVACGLLLDEWAKRTRAAADAHTPGAAS